MAIAGVVAQGLLLQRRYAAHGSAAAPAAEGKPAPASA
jgi:hypothetical protein